MSGERESNPISRIVDWITDTSDKVKTMFGALTAMIGAALVFYKLLVPDVGTPLPAQVPAAGSAPAVSARCYRLQLIPQGTISISSVKSGNVSKWFDFSFVNDCTVDFMVRVEFKPVDGGIAIKPTENWPGYAIPAGEQITKELIPPNIEVLTEKSQYIQILVSIYREDNQELIGKDTGKIQLVP